jgi:hypothetical protein
MITADKLSEVTRIKKDALVSILENSSATPSWAYAIKKCKFIGITNGGQFCYGLEYDGRLSQRGYQARRPEKVFLNYNPAVGTVTADVQLTELA